MTYMYKLFKALVLAVALIAAGRTQAMADSILYTLTGDTEQSGRVNFAATASGAATGSVSTWWPFSTATSISVSLPGDITFSFGTDKTERGLASNGSLLIEGATDTGGYITLSAPNSKIIYYVALVNNSEQVIHEDWNAMNSYTYHFAEMDLKYIYVSYGDFIPIGGATISGIAGAYIYDGVSKCPDPVVTCFGRTLTKNEHYTVGYSNNVKTGTAVVIVSGISPYHGTIRQEFEIVDCLIEEWEAGSYEVNTNRTVERILVNGNVTLTIAEGVKLTVNSYLSIAQEAMLTLNGTGTLTIKNYTTALREYNPNSTTGGSGHKGYDGISGNIFVDGCTVIINGGRGGIGGAGGGKDLVGGDGGPGGIGGAGINGSLTVQSGTVTVTGGTGGEGGYAGYSPKSTITFIDGDQDDGGLYLYGNGGAGGAGGLGITGSLEVISGTVTVTGGYGGTVGIGGELASNDDKGSPGKAFGGTVTCDTPGYIIQDRNGNGNWSNLASGGATEKQYARVTKASLVLTLNGILSDGLYWATFYHGSVRYSLPEGAQAYTMGSDHHLYRLDTDGRTIRENTAVVIVSDKQVINLVMDDGSSSITDHAPGSNILHGSDSPVHVSSIPDGKSAYVLSVDNNGVLGFRQYTGTAIPAHKAYYVQ